MKKNNAAFMEKGQRRAELLVNSPATVVTIKKNKIETLISPSHKFQRRARVEMNLI